MGKDAELQIFAKRLADVRPWRVMVALAFELARASEIKPGLKVVGDSAVQQRAIGVVRVVALGLCTRWPSLGFLNGLESKFSAGAVKQACL